MPLSHEVTKEKRKNSHKKAQNAQNNISFLCFLCLFAANIFKIRAAAFFFIIIAIHSRKRYTLPYAKYEIENGNNGAA
jgi:hypothetical protein